MSRMIFSKRKAEAISNGVMLVSLAILFWTNSWWPGILLAIWAWLGTRQYLTGRMWDFSISTVILVGLFIVSYFNLNLSVLIPVLFVVGGIYIIFREYYFAEDTEGEEKAQELKDDSDTN